jgi:SNF2 family DNA or RNA helicase
LVLFLWKHQRDLLVAEAERRGLNFAVFDGDTNSNDRLRIVQSYQAGLYDALFGHPKSVGHGHTLTRGTSTIWSSPTYDLEIFVQASSRQRRLGQTLKTETVVVLAEDTLDERVYEAMMTKDARMTNLLELFSSMTPITTKKKKK